jgi:prepilin-type N-terminal cleavage/methylation domain-containing protein
MKERGFTLAELLIVLAIAGLTASAGGWTLANLRDAWILRSQSAMLTLLMEDARLRAVLSNTNVRIRAGTGSVVVQDAAADALSFPLYPGVALTATAPSVLFSSRGTASPGASWTMTRRQRQSVLIIAPTGRVRTQY